MFIFVIPKKTQQRGCMENKIPLLCFREMSVAFLEEVFGLEFDRYHRRKNRIEAFFLVFRGMIGWRYCCFEKKGVGAGA
jgi:hypothetical protein